jgi:GNAT superfamily N-acetyltransferase
VFVAPEHRRAGLATRLINHIMDDAKRCGATQVGLEFWLFNEAARTCFEKVGFGMNQASMWRDVT